MKRIHLLWIFAVLFIVSCGQTPTPSAETTKDNTTAPNTEKRIGSVDEKSSDKKTKSKEQLISGDSKTPTFFSQSTNKIVRLVADATSYDKKFGESHRVLKIYTGDNEQEKELKSILLPVNSSPDFRYSFADVYAEGEQEWLLIQGYYFFFVYDVVNDHLSEKIFPAKPKNFEGVDAQSGSITSLLLENNQVKGMAQDIGHFAIDIADLKSQFK